MFYFGLELLLAGVERTAPHHNANGFWRHGVHRLLLIITQGHPATTFVTYEWWNEPSITNTSQVHRSAIDRIPFDRSNWMFHQIGRKDNTNMADSDLDFIFIKSSLNLFKMYSFSGKLNFFNREKWEKNRKYQSIELNFFVVVSHNVRNKCAKFL